MAASPIRSKRKIVAGIEADLLRRVRVENGLSRAELARALHLAPSTVGIYVDRLIRDGYLIERDGPALESGRPPKQLLPHGAAGKFVGVDFYPRNLFVIAIDFSLNVVRRAHRTVPANEPVEGILSRVEAALETVIAGDRRPLLGIGAGVPGTVDEQNGLASDSDYIHGWDNVPVGPRLAERFGVPVQLQHNIRLMAMAELWLGDGRGLKNFVCLGIRTGIGAGAIVNGQLVCGAHGGAGEVGLWPAPGSGGDRDHTMEAVGSLGAILARASEAAGHEMDFAEFTNRVRAGDRPVLEALKQAADVHAATVYQLQVLFDPERIIVVGPLAELGPVFLAPLKAAVRRRCHRAPPEIVCSRLGQFGGALGAAALALHRWQPAR